MRCAVVVTIIICNHVIVVVTIIAECHAIITPYSSRHVTSRRTAQFSLSSLLATMHYVVFDARSYAYQFAATARHHGNTSLVDAVTWLIKAAVTTSSRNTLYYRAAAALNRVITSSSSSRSGIYRQYYSIAERRQLCCLAVQVAK